MNMIPQHHRPDVVPGCTTCKARKVTPDGQTAHAPWCPHCIPLRPCIAEVA